MSDEDDVADPYGRFAAYYDLEYAAHDADLDMYRDFATRAGGPILELGCGSGRVLSALRQTGLPLAGVDASPAMIALARQRLGASVELAQADMSDLRGLDFSSAPFWMAFSAINTFLHLPNPTAQIAALQSARRFVVPGGLLLLDLMVPEPHYLASLDGRLLHEFAANLPDGARLDKWVTRTHDLATQTIETTVFYETTSNPSGNMARVVDRYTTRYIHQFELDHLLARAGWRLISLYGSYDLEPFHSDADRMIALATWGDIDARED